MKFWNGLGSDMHACCSSGTFAAGLALTLVSSAAFAQRTAPPPDRWVILVGDARGSDRTALEAAMADTAEALRQEYGYSRDRIVRIFGADATRDGIRQGLLGLSPRPGPNDSLFTFVLLPPVAGRPGPFFLPADGREDAIWTLVGFDEIEDAVARLRTRTSLTVVNACPSLAHESRLSTKQSVMQPGLSSTLLFCDQRAPDQGARRFAEALPGVLRSLASSAKERVTDIELTGRLRESLPGLQLDLRRTTFYSDEGFSFVVGRLRITNLLLQLENAETPDAEMRAIDAIVPAARAAEDPDNHERVAASLNAIAAGEQRDRGVRLRAVSALGVVGAQRSVPDLTNLSRSPAAPPEIRRASVEALARIGGASTLPPILAALADPSSVVRVAAVRGTGTHKSLTSAEPLVGRVSDPDSDVRAAALQMIAVLAKPGPGGRNLITPIAASARKATQQALMDPAAHVRREAVNARARLGVDLARDQTVLKMLTSDPDDSVRAAIALTIGREYRAEIQMRPGPGERGGTPRAIPPGGYKEPEQRSTALSALIRAADVSSPIEVRTAAMWSLGELADPKGSATLMSGLSDPQEAVREAAAEALGKMRYREAVTAIAKLLDEESARLRSTAARALGAIHDAAAAPILVAHLKTETNVYVRQSIDEAIRRLPTPSMAALAAALQSDWPNVRLDAVERLATIDDPGAAQFALDALGDPDPEVRRATIRVFDRRGPAWLDALATGLQSSTTMVRLGSAAALGTAGNATAAGGKALLATVDREQNPGVRAQIVSSLGAVQPPAAEIEVALLAAALDPDPMLRDAAAAALARYSTPRARDMLLALTGDEAQEVRETAIRGLRASVK